MNVQLARDIDDMKSDLTEIKEMIRGSEKDYSYYVHRREQAKKQADKALKEVEGWNRLAEREQQLLDKQSLTERLMRDETQEKIGCNSASCNS